MLHIESFSFNPFEENTYLISDEQQDCWIVDPGMYSPHEAQRLDRHIIEKGLNLRAIINTHAHIDHLLGIPYLLGRYDVPIFLHEREYPLWESAQEIARSYGLMLDSLPAPDHLLDDQAHEILLGREKLACRPTPGHSPGSLSFYYGPGQWVISGDALFAGSIGRTDLPGGNHDQLIASIKEQLLSLPPETRVYPGHGPSTDIGQEARTNPFLIHAG